MTHQAAPLIATQPASGHRIAIVGAGPVGVRCAQELLTRGFTGQIVLFGDEAWAPYNRVKLSSLLAGEIRLEQITTDVAVDARARGQLVEQLGCRIEEIDADHKRIRDAEQRWHDYDTLILAVGSRAHVPNVPGVDCRGVYTFRDLRDTGALLARTARSRRIAVIGGGLLGLEAARALQRGHTEVVVVQQAARLMNRQLDDIASEKLRARVESLGIEVITGNGLAAIVPTESGDQLRAIRLRDGREIACDTVLLTAGIKANIELARQSWIRVATGIVVDDTLQTSEPDIYAIGECAEHRGRTYGLVAPGYEQAAVLADHLLGGNARYQGSINATRLKVVGEAVFSVGEVAELVRRPHQQILTWQSAEGGYRKLVLERGQLSGAVSIGDHPESARLQESVQNRRTLNPLQRWRFRRHGRCWRDDGAASVNAWPAAATVCQCMGVSRGRIGDCIASGCDSIETIGAGCGAGTVCGSCRPLLQELIGGSAPRQATPGSRNLLIGAAAAALVCTLLALLPAATVADSVQTRGWFERLWNDGLFKQISGFTMVGLSLIGLLLSLRKRIKAVRFGNFSTWRLLHVLLGVAALLTLALHTGFNPGINLNRWLLVDFLLLMAIGVIAAVAIGCEHRLKPAQARVLRSTMLWGHLLAVWPLPVLLGFHIVSVYYF